MFSSISLNRKALLGEGFANRPNGRLSTEQTSPIIAAALTAIERCKGDEIGITARSDLMKEMQEIKVELRRFPKALRKRLFQVVEIEARRRLKCQFLGKPIYHDGKYPDPESKDAEGLTDKSTPPHIQRALKKAYSENKSVAQIQREVALDKEAELLKPHNFGFHKVMLNSAFFVEWLLNDKIPSASGKPKPKITLIEGSDKEKKMARKILQKMIRVFVVAGQ